MHNVLDNFAVGDIIHVAPTRLTVKHDLKSYRGEHLKYCYYQYLVGTDADGNKILIGHGLLGNWPEHAGPRRGFLGDIEMTRQAQACLQKTVTESLPDPRYIYELVENKANATDPASLPDYQLPFGEMDEAERLRAWHRKLIAEISAIMDGKCPEVTTTTNGLERIEKLTQLRDTPFPNGDPTIEKPYYGSALNVKTR